MTGPLLAAVAGAEPHPAMILPFAAMLFSIAFAPVVLKHRWHRFYPVLAVALGSITVFYYWRILGAPDRVWHSAHEYAGFIALVGSLFVIAGGIHFDVKGGARPGLNVAFLAAGAVLANLVGTTGASMLLIRPWLRMNRRRIADFHVVFFIFLVSNVGGCLTPIGDPPLFLGFLKGVPFWWPAVHLWQAWLLVVGLLLGIFFVFEWRSFLRVSPQEREPVGSLKTWTVQGWHNFGFLAVVLGAVFWQSPPGAREMLMIAAAVGSYFTTSREIHEANEFGFQPITEVAWLFLGLFATMLPALDYLQMHAAELGLSSPWQFYGLTGALSGVLDNAPTYLAFLAAAFGLAHLNIDDQAHFERFLATREPYLVAISLGAVFFGAMTYLGNGPNLMVKAITEAAGVSMPGFFGYVWKFALPILLPTLVLVALLFFSRWRVF